MKNNQLINILYTTLKISIMVFDSDFKLEKSFPQNFESPLSYDFKFLIDEMERKNNIFSFYSGNFNEMMILYKHENNYLFFGPFRCNLINQLELSRKFNALSLQKKYQEDLYNYLKTLTFFPLNNCKEILKLIHYVFTGTLENLLADSIYNYTSLISSTINTKKIEALINQKYSIDDPLINLETTIMNIMNKCQNGSDYISDITSSFTNYISPIVIRDTLRSEKIYSILFIEKLSYIAYNQGLDSETVIQSRNSFIKESEQSKAIDECLIIRESALTYYIDNIKKIKIQKYPYLLTKILRYIHQNIHRHITNQEISHEFNISSAGLSNLFKRELDISVQKYIVIQKIEIAKTMLPQNYSINDIALSLGFYDSSHFSRVFKKLTKISPKDFRHSKLSN